MTSATIGALQDPSQEAAICAIFEAVHMWRRPKLVLTHPTFFGPGNALLDVRYLKWFFKDRICVCARARACFCVCACV